MRYVLLAMCLLVLSTSCRHAAVPQRPSVDLQGHRGARGLLPENTVASMIKAVDLGMHTLEMDVVVTADGIVVLSHEPYFSHQISTDPQGRPISKTDEKTHNIYAMSYDEVARYDVGLRMHERFVDQVKVAASKPTLEQVVEAVKSHPRSDVRYNIEIKRVPEQDGIFHPPLASYADIVVQEIRRLKIAGRTTIQSFDNATLQYVRKTYPDLSLGYLVGNKDDIHEQITTLGFVPEIYSPHYLLVTDTLVSYCRRHGMHVIPWTVNEVPDMQRLLTLGVDGLISDYPDKLSDVYQAMVSNARTQ